MNFLVRLFRILAPFALSEAVKVAPVVEAEINRILAEAKARVTELRARHNIKAIQADVDAKVKEVRDTAEHHVELIKAAGQSAVAEAQTVLPPLNLPGPTGVTGPAT